MDLKQVVKIWMKVEAMDDEIEEAAVGDKVQIPAIKRLKISGRQGRLEMVFVVEE